MKHERAFVTPQVPNAVMGSIIPRVIHQTYPSKDLPGVLAENVHHIKKLNPTFEYVLHDDDDIVRFIKTEYGPEFFSYFDRINPRYGAARADFFRYLLIYKRGGVYLDIKSSMSQPLDRVLDDADRYLLATWRDPSLSPHRELAAIPGREFQNWHIIAVQGHPFLKAVIDSVLRNIDEYRPWRHGVGKNAVLRVTGPIAYTLAIHPIIDLYPKRVVRSEADLSLQYTIPVVGSHTRLFRAHYSVLAESVVRLTGAAAYSGKLFFFLRIHLILRAIRSRVFRGA